jgi:hypothetical protein
MQWSGLRLAHAARTFLPFPARTSFVASAQRWAATSTHDATFFTPRCFAARLDKRPLAVTLSRTVLFVRGFVSVATRMTTPAWGVIVFDTVASLLG